MTHPALATADEFEAADGTYRVTTAEFEARVDPESDRWTVVCEVPAIEAAVEGEVGDAVAEGWFETLERRLDGVTGVTRTDEVATPDVRREGETVVVETSFAPGNDPAEEALAVVNYVEGTWFQGLIPGYDYVEAVAAMRQRARRHGGDA
ncbi:MAG: DUF5813 family protein [Halobacteriaceae archaeon]